MKCSDHIFRLLAPLGLIGLLVSGCFTQGARRADEALPTGLHPPRIQTSFAVSNLWFGKTWEIFVEGEDPDGDMDYIWVEVSQLGGNMWSNHRVYLEGDRKAHFKGVIHLPTPSLLSRSGWQTLRAVLRIHDRANHYSNPVTHEVELGRPTRTPVPAQWKAARAQRLGTVFFDFDLDRDGDHERIPLLR
ncbi:hypothetical protein SAMN02746041_01398 [Desulfacinum hydrothermale DSM 13146]|uniref:Lipoprotein n=1 Tax=Desulfacinum hydrothermale DSM 13146 TaxID=1121390 RepID=A0A1W1XF16_9BACT|nr:hypothetical protein [Desulfacinum hydrothermale]SMC22354.1 hypothetical protein SAMN02746041_01398 [Desulfacinum hydrothermale DSM 13146]